jgi:hypothetical protein
MPRMLFGYPIEAVTENNWLHECFCCFIESIHENLACGTVVTDWLDVIPEKHRNKLKSRLMRSGGLGDKLNSYQKALAKLTSVEQALFLKAFNEQNKIDLLLSCQCDCDSINDLLQKNIRDTVEKPLTHLFEYAFGLLTDLEIRDQHYHTIYKSIPSRVCPFCGYEKFSAPKSKREALDHYLLKDSYPFAGINLRNLVPMGHKCNSQYKLTENILYKNINNGLRRKAFDPYNHNLTIKLSLNKSQPFAGITGIMREPLPKWEIEFIPMSDEVDTWDDVFCIKERYIRDVLDAEFKSWLDFFAKWYQRKKKVQDSDQDLINEIEVYAIDREDEGFGEEAFLKAAVFRMLHLHCSNGNHRQRFIRFIRDHVNALPM